MTIELEVTTTILLCNEEEVEDDPDSGG